MEPKIYKMLKLPVDSSYGDVKEEYENIMLNGYYLYNKEELKLAWKEYTVLIQREKSYDENYLKKLFLKILIGIPIAAYPFSWTYLEGFESSKEFALAFIPFIYLFFAGWGFEATTMIKFKVLNKIPFFGLYIYLILKLSIGICLGGAIAFYHLIRWIYRKFKAI